MPDRLPADLIDAGCDPATIGFLVFAYAESNRYLLDGRFPPARLRRIPGWTRRREEELKAAGEIVVDDGHLVLASFPTVNGTRAEVEDRRAKRAAAGAIGGSVTAANAEMVGRNPDGTFAARSEHCPAHPDAPRLESKKERGFWYCPAKLDSVNRCRWKAPMTPDATPDATPSVTPNAGGYDPKQVLGQLLGQSSVEGAPDGGQRHQALASPESESEPERFASNGNDAPDGPSVPPRRTRCKECWGRLRDDGSCRRCDPRTEEKSSDLDDLPF